MLAGLPNALQERRACGAVKMRFLLFVQHFYPSREIGAKRPSEMAKHLIAQGHQVDVLCARTSAPWDEIQRASLASCAITQVPVPIKFAPMLLKAWKALKAKVSRRRAQPRDERYLVNTSKQATQVGTLRRWYFSFEALYCGLKLWAVACIPAAWFSLKKVKNQIVITSCPPMSTALVIRLIRALGSRRVRWIIDLRDPFMSPSHPSSTSALRTGLERWAERACLSDCDVIVAASPGIERDIKARLPALAGKIRVVYNGYDGQARLSEVRHLGSTLKLLSAGTIYLQRDPRPLLDGIKIALASGLPSDAFHLTFLGNCENPTRDTLLQWIADRGLSHAVSVHAAVPPSEVEQFMQRVHVLVNFAQGQEALIPAKTYDYMASGKEVLTITEQDSETARIVTQATCGPVVLPDATAVAGVLLHLYQRYITNGETYSPNIAAISAFSRDHQNAQMLRICEALM
jgi:glycosyltransferase involved in cell wall biosynthesis